LGVNKKADSARKLEPPAEESAEEIKSANHGRAVFRKGPVRDRETVGSMDIDRGDHWVCRQCPREGIAATRVRIIDIVRKDLASSKHRKEKAKTLQKTVCIFA
jgi:hypothetical protein